MTAKSESTFHARARYEAARYGTDAWVWVRELVQNARDAGAAHVCFEVSSSGGLDRIACRDDGSGMTFAHARQYLFTLYASSKRGGRQSAGRFGIGFWSILRYAPTAVTIRSRSRAGEGWQVRLDGDLNVVQRESVRMEPGTEIVIERPVGEDELEARLRAAVLRDAPFVTQRGHPDRPVNVRINGVGVHATFDLPPPCLRFRRSGLRGVVGLGPEPGVEIFAHGLRVREAASLDELLLTGRRVRTVLPAAAGGFAPRALIDSSRLTVLLARGEAREDRSLRRLVTVGRREIRRLVRAELDRYARPSWTALGVEWVRDLWSTSRPPLVAWVVLLTALGAIAGWHVAVRGWGVRTGPTRAVASDAVSASGVDGLQPYTDLGGRYLGPAADVLDSFPAAVDLRYRPASESHHFAGLLMTGMDAAGSPLYPSSPWITTGGEPCRRDCLEVEMAVADDSGVLRLPVATGYAVDGDGVTLNGEPLALTAEVGGLPAVDLGGVRGGRLVYRSGEAAGHSVEDGGHWPPLPWEALEVCSEIKNLSPDARRDAVVDWVRRRVVYDTSPETARRHLAEQRLGRGLFERSLIVAAGDCDIQNALVAAMLHEIGAEARLAVGWVGVAGRTRPGLHAWVEYLAPDGRWQVVDASMGPRLVPPEAARGVDEVQAEENPTRSVQRMLVGGLLALLLAAVILRLRQNAPQRNFSPGGRDDMADLVRAAAVHPEFFGGIHALFGRKLVPVLARKSISVARAVAVAGRGMLAVGGREGVLALRAARRGTVIDGGTTVGIAAAEALGAVDLDDWHRLLSRSWNDPIARRVGEALTAAGEPFHLQIARDVGEDIAILDGARLGLSARERWIVLDAASDLWSRTVDLARRRPAAAALFLALSVIDRLGLPQALRDPFLAGLARAALDERDGGRP